MDTNNNSVKKLVVLTIGTHALVLHEDEAKQIIEDEDIRQELMDMR